MEHTITQETWAKDHAAPLTELQRKAVEIVDQCKDLSLKDKLHLIALTFGCKTGEIYTNPCKGKWRGTSDILIRFDNGASLSLGNRLTPKAKTVKVQKEFVNSALAQYHPDIVQATKEAALPKLRKLEAADNEVAVQKGLRPYRLLNVELYTEGEIGYMGWYYVTLSVGGRIRAHLETDLYHAILNGKVSETHTRERYFPAGSFRESDVDYIFNNVGFSSKSSRYTLPLQQEARYRAEKAILEQTGQNQQSCKEQGTNIYELCEGNSFARMVATYSLEPKAAMVAYIRQSIHKDFNTWNYPEEIPGMRMSDTVKDHWYYDDPAGRRVICAYPKSSCL